MQCERYIKTRLPEKPYTAPCPRPGYPWIASGSSFSATCVLCNFHADKATAQGLVLVRIDEGKLAELRSDPPVTGECAR